MTNHKPYRFTAEEVAQASQYIFERLHPWVLFKYPNISEETIRRNDLRLNRIMAEDLRCQSCFSIDGCTTGGYRDYGKLMPDGYIDTYTARCGHRKETPEKPKRRKKTAAPKSRWKPWNQD